MRKNIISRKTILAAAFASLLVSTTASAQGQANKRESLYQVLDQSRANDYVPAFFNIHFKDKTGWGAVQSHIQWFRQTHVDFVNVKYEYIPQHQQLKTSSDWENFKAIDSSEWSEQLLVISELKRELGDEAFIIPTVYSPLAVLVQAATGPEDDYKEVRKSLVEQIRKSPKTAAPVLQKITDAIVDYIRQARQAGADGFYVSSQGADEETFAGKEFAELIKPYDRQLADAAAEVAPFNILHICESGGHITPDTFDNYLDYPGSVVNPPVHNWKDNKKQLDLKQISELFGRPVLGGFERSGAIYKGSIEDAKAEVDAILENAPANIIIGADDSVPNDIDPERVREIVDYIHTWRQTHKN